MKKLHVSFVTALLVLSIAVVSAQQTGTKPMDAMQQKHTMAMMQDTTMADMVMDHIAGDEGLRMKMMEKMMSHAHQDSTSMMQMCRKMMDDKDMHSMMMKMMGGGMKGMKDMKGMMHEKDGDKKESKDHKDHH